MQKQLNPYYVMDKTIYFTDGVEEVAVHTFHQDHMAETMGRLLNEAYSAAYQDGLNDSSTERYKDLVDHVKFLSIENSRLKRLLK